MRRGVLAVVVWAVLTLAAIVWLALGYITSEFGVAVLFLVAASLAYGPARMIALRRYARVGSIEPRMVPLRISYGITGLITFGPAVAFIFDLIPVLPAVGCFLAGAMLTTWVTAIFSDGYQGLWLDALVFHGNLAPPEEDWIAKKR